MNKELSVLSCFTVSIAQLHRGILGRGRDGESLGEGGMANWPDEPEQEYHNIYTVQLLRLLYTSILSNVHIYTVQLLRLLHTSILSNVHI